MELELEVSPTATIYAYSIDVAYRNRKWKRRIHPEEDWYLSELDRIQSRFLELLFDPWLGSSYDLLYQNLLEWVEDLMKRVEAKKLKYITPNPYYIHQIYKPQV